MERLTKTVNGVVTYIGTGNKFGKWMLPAELSRGQIRAVMKRLAAYEGTGMEPDEINDMALEVATLKTIESMYDGFGKPDHIRDLLQAEQDGRLVNYLPGDTVYDRFGMEWTVTSSEIHKFYDGALRYLYRCGHSGTNDYCALYSDEILTREEAEAALKGGEG